MINILERTHDNIPRWIHVDHPTTQDVQEISDTYHIPRDFINDVRDPFENARSEHLQQNDKAYSPLIVLQYVKPTENARDLIEFNTRTFAMVLTENTLITACEDFPPFLKEVAQDVADNKELVLDKEAFVLEVFWRIKLEYVAALRDVNSKIEQMQNDIEKSSRNEELYRLIAIQKSLVYLETAIENNRFVLDELKDSPRFDTSPQQKSLLHDVLIETYQAENMVEELSDIAKNLSNTFSSVINNNLNNIMKVLTSITIILTIPTIVSGLWGMNMGLPFGSHGSSFWLLIGLSLLLSIIVIYWLKKQDYL